MSVLLTIFIVFQYWQRYLHTWINLLLYILIIIIQFFNDDTVEVCIRGFRHFVSSQPRHSSVIFAVEDVEILNRSCFATAASALGVEYPTGDVKRGAVNTLGRCATGAAYPSRGCWVRLATMPTRWGEGALERAAGLPICSQLDTPGRRISDNL